MSAPSPTNPPLQIKNVGRMWRVLSGKTTLAFATTYPIARMRANELSAMSAKQAPEWNLGQWRTKR